MTAANNKQSRNTAPQSLLRQKDYSFMLLSLDKCVTLLCCMITLRLYKFHFIEEGFESTQLVDLFSMRYPKAILIN